MVVSLNTESLRIWQEQDLEHLRYEYDLKPQDYVIDIGSYRREWADEITRRYGCAVECFDALDNRAAWMYDGTIKTGGAYYYTSMKEPGETEYRCEDILKYLDRPVRLMKINIEGGEYELLNYIAVKGKMGVIEELQVQFHEIDGGDVSVLYEYLSGVLGLTHELAWRYPFCWESWRIRPNKQTIC